MEDRRVSAITGQVASLGLCQELYKLSKWSLTEKHWYHGKPTYHAPYGWECPAYDLSFLFEKLPQNSWVGYVDASGERGYALAKTYAWNAQGDDIDKIAECHADTLEDAACKLAIELWKQGVLKRKGIVMVTHKFAHATHVKYDIPYTDAMDTLVLTTAGIVLARPPNTGIAVTVGLLRKLVLSCFELASGEDEEE